MPELMLTTVDNPFHPYDEFDDWLMFDTSNKYFTLNYLARIANTSHEQSDDEYNAEVDRAIREICRLNLSGMHRMVTDDDFNEKTEKVRKKFGLPPWVPEN